MRREMRRLRDEAAQSRIRARQLEKELIEARASAATANGIAGAVFEAIKRAQRGGHA